MKHLLNDIYLKAYQMGASKSVMTKLIMVLDGAEEMPGRKVRAIFEGDMADDNRDLLNFLTRHPYVAIVVNGKAIEVVFGTDVRAEMPNIGHVDPSLLVVPKRNVDKIHLARMLKAKRVADEHNAAFFAIFVEEFKSLYGKTLVLDNVDKKRLVMARKSLRERLGRVDEDVLRRVCRFTIRFWIESEIRTAENLMGFVCGRPLDWFIKREISGLAGEPVGNGRSGGKEFTGHTSKSWDDIHRYIEDLRQKGRW